MKKIVTLLVFIMMFVGLNQSDAQSNFVRRWTRFGINLESTTKTTPWVYTLGWSVVHDDGTKWFTHLFSPHTWNMAPYPARTACEKIIDTTRGWSAEVVFAYNRYKAGNYISWKGDNTPVPVNNRYGIVSFDFHAKYNFNKIYDLNKLWGSREEIFEPFCVFGHGYTYSDKAPHHSFITMNMGLGFNVFVYKGLGVQLQSLAKFGLRDKFPFSGSNYLQHSICVVYKMNPLGLHRSKSYKFKKHSIKKVL